MKRALVVLVVAVVLCLTIPTRGEDADSIGMELEKVRPEFWGFGKL